MANAIRPASAYTPSIQQTDQKPNTQEPEQQSQLPASAQLEKQKKLADIAEWMRRNKEVNTLLMEKANTLFAFSEIPSYLTYFFLLDWALNEALCIVEAKEYKNDETYDFSHQTKLNKLKKYSFDDAVIFVQNGLLLLLINLIERKWASEQAHNPNTFSKSVAYICTEWSKFIESFNQHWEAKGNPEHANRLKMQDIDKRIVTPFFELLSMCLAREMPLKGFLENAVKPTSNKYTQFPFRNHNAQTIAFIIFIHRLGEKICEELCDQSVYKTQPLKDIYSHLLSLQALFAETSALRGMLDHLSICYVDILECKYNYLKRTFEIIKKLKKVDLGSFVQKIDKNIKQLKLSIQSELQKLDKKHPIYQQMSDLMQYVDQTFTSFLIPWFKNIQADMQELIKEINNWIYTACDLLEIKHQQFPNVEGIAFKNVDCIQVMLLEPIHLLLNSSAKQIILPLYFQIQKIFYEMGRYYNYPKYNKSPSNALKEFIKIIEKLSVCFKELDERSTTFDSDVSALWSDFKLVAKPYFGLLQQYIPFALGFCEASQANRTTFKEPEKQTLYRALLVYKQEIEKYDFSSLREGIKGLVHAAQIKGMRQISEVTELFEVEIARQEKFKKILLEHLTTISLEGALDIADSLAMIHFETVEDIHARTFEEAIVSVQDFVNQSLECPIFSTIPSRFASFFQHFIKPTEPATSSGKIQTIKKTKHKKKKGSASKKKVSDQTQRKNSKPDPLLTRPQVYDFLNFSSVNLQLSGSAVDNALLRHQILTGTEHLEFYSRIINECCNFTEPLSWPLTYAVSLALFSSLSVEQGEKVVRANDPKLSSTLFESDPQVETTKLRSSHRHTSLVPASAPKDTLAHCTMIDQATLGAHFPFAYKTDCTASLLKEVYFNHAEKIDQIEQICHKSMHHAFILWRSILDTQDAVHEPLVFRHGPVLKNTSHPFLAEIKSCIKEDAHQLLYPLTMLNEMFSLSAKERLKCPLVYTTTVLSMSALLLYQAAENKLQHIPYEIRAFNLDQLGDLLKPDEVKDVENARYVLKQVSRYPCAQHGHYADLFEEINRLVRWQNGCIGGWADDKMMQQIKRRYQGKDALPAIEADIVKVHEKCMQEAMKWLTTAQIIILSLDICQKWQFYQPNGISKDVY